MVVKDNQRKLTGKILLTAKYNQYIYKTLNINLKE